MKSESILGAVRSLRRQGIDVLYLDKQILVINKPSGLVTQSTRSEDPSKLAQSILPTMTNLRAKLPLRLMRTVHRLDKSTTGCLVLTQTDGAAKSLSQQFSERSIGKTYLALVDTRANAFRGKSSGLLSTGWTSDGDGRPSIVPADAPEAKHALTEWKILASSPMHSVSLLRLTLHTGLKHQLRIHCASALQAPIIGDAQYTPHDHPPIEPHIPPNSVFLHASSISMTRHSSRPTSPGTRKQLKTPQRIRLTIGAPLPSQFRTLCASLRIPLLDESRRGHIAIDGISKGLFVPKDDIADPEDDVMKDEDGALCTKEVFQFDVPELGGRYFASAMVREEKSLMDALQVLAKEDPPHPIT